MSTLVYILIFSAVSGLLALAGGVALLLRADWVKRFSLHFVSFAVGALLSAAFFDLLPEAFELAGDAVQPLFAAVLGGIVGFFLLESLILKFHPHHHDEEGEFHHHTTPNLLLVGDTVHNFIDGAAVAAAFLTSVPLGIVTALAVAAHELPQEIGDFSIMLHHGWTRARVLAANVISSLSNVMGALLTFFLGSQLESKLPLLLAGTAGMFIYIATADLIPEISREHRRDKTSRIFILLGLGITAVAVLKYYLE